MRSVVVVVLLAFQCAGVGLAGPRAVPAAEPSSEFVLLGKTRSLTGIDEVLAKPISVDFLETPLREVLAQIHDKTDVSTTGDIAALVDAGYDLDLVVVTWQAEGVPLASSLDAICKAVDLEWIVLDDVIEVTSPDGAAARQMARMIDVTEITDEPEFLAELLETVVHPHAWARYGGPGVITADETRDASTLIVTNSWQVQRGVAGVIEGLRKCVAAGRTEHSPLGVGGYWSDATTAVAARKALSAPLTLDVDETPLRDFAATVTRTAKVPLAIDWRALVDGAVDVDACLLTGSFRGLRLARLLERLLAPNELTWDLQHDRLTITTLEGAHAHRSVAVYPIGDLLEKGRSVSKLIDTVQATVTPDAWETVGGGAVIRAFSPRDPGSPCGLVVVHTAAGHRAVGEFLHQLPR